MTAQIYHHDVTLSGAWRSEGSRLHRLRCFVPLRFTQHDNSGWISANADFLSSLSSPSSFSSLAC